jgi:hypothetical protein
MLNKAYVVLTPLPSLLPLLLLLSLLFKLMPGYPGEVLLTCCSWP